MLNESDYTVLPEDYNSFDKSFKVIIVGNSGVGKSCITTKATKNIFENYYSATIGFEFHTFKVRVKGKDIRLQIWDTCGQETYRSLIHGFYRNSSLAILVYSIDNLKSFEDLGIWINDIKTNTSPDVKIFLIGNKSDLNESREVPKEKAEQFVKDNELKLFLESSAKTGLNINRLFAEAANFLYEEYLQVLKTQEISDSIPVEKDNAQSNINEVEDESSIYLNSKRRKKNKCCGA